MNFLLKPFLVAVFVFSTVFTVHAETVENMPLTGLADTPNTSFEQLKGQWLYVDFWASWCGPCKKSFPFMNQIQSAYQSKNLKVIAISVDDTESAALKFLKYTAANFAVFHDPKGALAQEFKVPGMPSSYLISPEGEIVYKHVGFTEESGNELLSVFSKYL